MVVKTTVAYKRRRYIVLEFKRASPNQGEFGSQGGLPYHLSTRRIAD
ncbi:MAG: hypothetical protein ACK40X_05525 [Armatimonadota bacterium]